MANKVVLQCVMERTENDENVVAAIPDWFDGNLTVLGRQFREELLSVAVRDSSLLRKNYVSCGEPGTPWGRLYVTRKVNGKERDAWRAVGSQEWAKFLAAKEIPYSAKLVVDYLNAKGYPNMGGPGPFIGVDMRINEPIGATTNGGHDRWILLECMVLEDTLREADVDRSVAEFLREFSDKHAPVFADISYSTGQGTGLEYLIDGDPVENLLDSRAVLRGYSWITVMSQEIGDKLGGIEALVDSGAFHEVAQLRNGGYWLRATEKYDQYQMPEAERVFRVLAPVLLEGKPFPPGRFELPHKIVREDAADYR